MKNNNVPINYFENINKSSKLVKQLGNSKINNKSLSEFLTIEGVDYWELYSAELSHRHVNNILGSDKIYPQPLTQLLIRKINIIRFHLSQWKSYFNFKINKNEQIDNLKKLKYKPIMFLAFSKHLYRDVLMPISKDHLLQKEDKVTIGQDYNSFDLAQSSSFIDPWAVWDKETKINYTRLKNLFINLKEQFDKSSFIEYSIPLEHKNKKKYFYFMFDDLFDIYLPNILFHVITAKKILKKSPPSILISPDVSDPRSRVYTILCRSLNITTIDVQFGLLGNESVEWQYLISDYVLVWGEKAKNFLLTYGVSKNKIIITGSPRHDFKYSLSKTLVEKKRKELKIPSNKSVFVLASTFNDKHHSNYVRPDILNSMKEAIFKSVLSCPNIVLIVKPHPFESINETKKYIKESPNKIIYADSKSDIRELIHISDAFLSFGSTTTIDALIADKVIISPIFPGWIFSEYINEISHFRPKSESEMYKIFKSFNGKFFTSKQSLSNSSIKSSLKKLIYKYDASTKDLKKSSTRRISKIIMNCMN